MLGQLEESSLIDCCGCCCCKHAETNDELPSVMDTMFRVHGPHRMKKRDEVCNTWHLDCLDRNYRPDICLFTRSTQERHSLHRVWYVRNTDRWIPAAWNGLPQDPLSILSAAQDSCFPPGLGQELLWVEIMKGHCINSDSDWLIEHGELMWVKTQNPILSFAVASLSGHEWRAVLRGF